MSPEERERRRKFREARRELLKAISQLQHRMDQMQAQARDEGRELNYQEWEEIHMRIGDL